MHSRIHDPKHRHEQAACYDGQACPAHRLETTIITHLSQAPASRNEFGSWRARITAPSCLSWRSRQARPGSGVARVLYPLLALTLRPCILPALACPSSPGGRRHTILAQGQVRAKRSGLQRVVSGHPSDASAVFAIAIAEFKVAVIGPAQSEKDPNTVLLLACPSGWLDAQSQICVLFARVGFAVCDSTWQGKAGNFKLMFAAKASSESSQFERVPLRCG